MFLDVSFREGTRHVVAVFIVGSFAGESTRKRAFTFFVRRDISREMVGNIFLRSIINLLFASLPALSFE